MKNSFIGWVPSLLELQDNGKELYIYRVDSVLLVSRSSFPISILFSLSLYSCGFVTIKKEGVEVIFVIGKLDAWQYKL